MSDRKEQYEEGLEYIKQLSKYNPNLKTVLEIHTALKNIITHLNVENNDAYFICGEAGEKDSMKLPEYVYICPAYGLDGEARYKKDAEYSAPGW